ncbi:MAG: ribonuclease P protein component [Cyanobium sp.]
MALPQKHRLRGRRVFDHVYRKADRFHGRWLTLRVMPEEEALLTSRDRSHSPSAWRCAVIVSSKVSKRAVHRNRLRRLLQSVLTLQPPKTQLSSWLVFSLKPGSCEADESDLLGECLLLLQKARLH